jgi:hypothetical protein
MILHALVTGDGLIYDYWVSMEVLYLNHLLLSLTSHLECTLFSSSYNLIQLMHLLVVYMLKD